MDAEGFRRVREAFEAALAQPPDGRDESLGAALADAPELLVEAQRMLAGHESDGDFLTPPSAQTLADLAQGGEPDGFLRPGTHIGDFELVRPLGAGGMGEVWVARQERPRRAVALKALRAGLGTERSRRRFEEEAEVLARLSHPGIAQVLASGVLPGPGGDPPRPWFAMELIEGASPLTEFAAGLALRRRLLLLREACVAVHHGHLRGVVHRDLKPDNCLVDGAGHVRVIDFGIARATGASDSELPLTAGDELLGTLAYMSPEQLLGQGDRIDVRTDVHALGVLLYELLTGRSPWSSEPSSWAALAREVSEVDPPPPSRVEPGLSRELDWIVARALAKEPERRYGSAQELADELGRYLDHQPLVAGPPGLGYAARKFARRNRPWVIGGAVAVLLLLLGSAGTGFGLLRSLERGRQLEARGEELEQERSRAELARFDAEEAREQAEDRLDRAMTINRFLDAMLRGADPMGIAIGVSRESTVGEMLDRASDQIVDAFPGRPDLEADTRLLIGVSYFGQGRYASAESHLVRARELFAGLLPERRYDWIKAGRLIATLRGRQGELESAIEGLERVRAEAYEVLDDDHPELGAIDADLAWALQESGRIPESVPLAEAALERFSALGPEFAPMAATAASHLARARRSMGDDAATEVAYREVRERIAGAYGPHSAQAGIAASNLGTFLFSRGRNAEARELFEEAVAILREEIPGDHPTVATLLYNLSSAIHELGDLEQARRIGVECLELNRRLWGSDHAETADASASLGLVQYDLSEFEQAGHSFAFAAEFRARTLGPEHRRTIGTVARTLDARIRLGWEPGASEAAAELEALYQRCVQEQGPQHTTTLGVARAGRRACAERPDGSAELWSSRAEK